MLDLFVLIFYNIIYVFINFYYYNYITNKDDHLKLCNANIPDYPPDAIIFPLLLNLAVQTAPV